MKAHLHANNRIAEKSRCGEALIWIELNDIVELHGDFELELTASVLADGCLRDAYKAV